MTTLGKKLSTMFAAGPLLAFSAFGISAPAHAHHPMGGALPGNFMDGLLSGIGHPVIGIDHLAFIIAVGIASAFLTARYLLPLYFVGGTVLGCLLYSVGGVALPYTEFFIAASVLVLGALVMSGRELNSTLCAALFSVAGLFHGSAYAGEILGVEAAPLVAYLIGFSLVQYAIAAAAGFLTRETWKASNALAMQPRLAGALLAGVGLTFLIERIESMAFPGV
ncbi:MAG: HupE/UreJ family protein [Hyphomicrobiaceae bacterium]